MLYFIQGTNIISKDKSGQIKCSDFAPALYPDSYQGQFIQTEIYKETACSIADRLKQTNSKDTDTLILNAKYFRQPGLVKAIFDQVPTASQIKSDIDFIINSRQLQAGKYIFIDITQEETNIYKFVVENNQYSISLKQRTENTILKRTLADKLKASISDDKLFNTLFSFHNIISTNEHLKTNQISKEDFADLNFSTSNVEIKNFTKADLSAFFKSLAAVIQNSIDSFVSNETTNIVKSPLTSYLPVEEILKQNSNAIIINELELLSNSTNTTSIKNTPLNVSYELKYFPQSKKALSPFSIWLLSETDNLSFEITKTIGKKNIALQITLSDLRSKLSKSFFSLGDKSLVKYLVELKSDCCNNLHLRIQTIDKEEFFFLIND